MDGLHAQLGTAPLPEYNAAGVAMMPAHCRWESPVALATAQEVQQVMKQLEWGGGSAAAWVFNGLRGPWAFDRTVVPHDGTTPSAVVRGFATFASTDAPNTWMYREDGDLHTNAGRSPATQQYRYALDEAAGTLGVYFLKGENAGKHFHDLQFAAAAQAPEGAPHERLEPPSIWPPAVVRAGTGRTLTNLATASRLMGALVRARGHHLCNQDVYQVDYAFRFAGSNLTSFSIRYDVKGPHKDYTARTEFSRS